VGGYYFSDAGENCIRLSFALPPQTTAGAVKRLFEGLNALKA
jgi:bifunctional pyridoxal-dependent enzyme with beta-cystathionase and maltose regulon repressor activities